MPEGENTSGCLCLIPVGGLQVSPKAVDPRCRVTKATLLRPGHRRKGVLTVGSQSCFSVGIQAKNTPQLTPAWFRRPLPCICVSETVPWLCSDSSEQGLALLEGEEGRHIGELTMTLLAAGAEA